MQGPRRGLPQLDVCLFFFVFAFGVNERASERARAANGRRAEKPQRGGGNQPKKNLHPPALDPRPTTTLSPSLPRSSPTGLHRAPAPRPHLRGDQLVGEQGGLPGLRPADARGGARRRGRGARRVGARLAVCWPGQGNVVVRRFCEFSLCFLSSFFDLGTAWSFRILREPRRDAETRTGRPKGWHAKMLFGSHQEH